MMTHWHELRFWYIDPVGPDRLFDFKRSHILPALARNGIDHFLMLDEPQFLLVRVEAS